VRNPSPFARYYSKQVREVTTKVAEAIKRLHDDGWRITSQIGSHRQFEHATRPGKVTVAGKPSDTIAPGTGNNIQKQAGWK